VKDEARLASVDFELEGQLTLTRSDLGSKPPIAAPLSAMGEDSESVDTLRSSSFLILNAWFATIDR
jgi:hypothetical protein